MQLIGLHHVTAMAGDLGTNLAFYTRVLGLRLVKRTVNFDDPSTYHLYFGDTVGTPGSALTFFYWSGQAPGRLGAGQVTAVAWSVSAGSLPFWRERLNSRGVSTGAGTRFGEEFLSFSDPDGLRLEIIATNTEDPRLPWAHPEIPGTHGLKGFHSVTLTHTESSRSARLLSEGMGGREILSEMESANRGRRRLALGAGGPGAWIDLLSDPSATRGTPGAGTVHHVAFRVADEAGALAAQQDWRSFGLGVSPVMDRTYFRSIYAREPGGVLFEVATDGPGFLLDEAEDQLGGRLLLPAQHEALRAQIEKALEPWPLLPPAA
jgi:glyoxalase family protein